METSDPDDFITLCWLAQHPQVKLVAVTVTPGSWEQVHLVNSALRRLGCDVFVGSATPNRRTECVSKFHYNIPGIQYGLREPDGYGYDVIAKAIEQYPDVTLFSIGPIKNLHAFLDRYPNIKLKQWFAQGGFAGDNLVEPQNRLAKFAGKETCATFNLNGDPNGALLALASNQICNRMFVSKNVCHGVVYDRAFHERFAANKDLNESTRLIYSTMEQYLTKHPGGKMFHDPLAAATMVDSTICEFKEVELYRSNKGRWGSCAATGTNTYISVAADYEKFRRAFCYET